MWNPFGNHGLVLNVISSKPPNSTKHFPKSVNHECNHEGTDSLLTIRCRSSIRIFCFVCLQPGSAQQKPKRLRVLADLSGSMYRFNGVDGRLERSMEAVCMVMEALENYEHKFKVRMSQHLSYRKFSCKKMTSTIICFAHTFYHGALRFNANHQCGPYEMTGFSSSGLRSWFHWHIFIYEAINGQLPSYTILLVC